MKYRLIILSFGTFIYSSQFSLALSETCLEDWSIDTSACDYTSLLTELSTKLSETCNHNASTELQLALNVESDTDVKVKISEVCSKDYFPWKEVSQKGYVFDNEIFDGGTYYNEDRESLDEHGIYQHRLADEPGTRLREIQRVIAKKRGMEFPTYLENFENCDLRTVMCCFVQDRQANDGNGNCVTPYEENCVDADPADNTDICYHDMQNSPTSSRTRGGFSLFEGEDEGDAHCHGFAWSNDPSDESSRYLGNNLFYVTLYDHLTKRGYVGNVPGAPKCACVEQMPIVSNADCRDISEISHSFFLSSHKESGFRSIVYDGTRIVFGNCDGNDLVTHYESVHSKESSNPVKGGCSEVEGKFLLEKGYVKQQDVEWIQVAGKGAHSDPTFSLQVNDGQTSHSSMTREEFVELWEKSTKVLLRRCDTCDPLHRQIYYKRHDGDVLPSNVDILHDFKEHWITYENNVWKQDFDLYSSYSNAIQDKNPWKVVDMNSTEPIGCCANSGPISASENQWNVWDTPRSEGGNKYGQRNIGLYVAMSTGLRPFSSPTSVPSSSMSPSSRPTSSMSPSSAFYLVYKGGNPSVTLGRCEGDCDNDNHCEPGLYCFQRSGYTTVPGCINGGSGDRSSTDYCVPINS